MQQLMLALHFPLFRPIRNATGERVSSRRLDYEKLIAAHSEESVATCYHTITSSTNLHFAELTPDGTKVITETSSGIRIIDLDETQHFWDLPLESSIERIKISPSGGIVLIYRYEYEKEQKHSIDCVDLEKRKIFRTFKDFDNVLDRENRLRCIQITPDDRYAFVAQKAAIVKRLDLVTGECVGFPLQETIRDNDHVYIAAISQTGTVAISTVDDDGLTAERLLLWEVQTGKILQTFEEWPSYYLQEDDFFQISLDQTTAVSLMRLRKSFSGKWRIGCWDLKAGKCIRALQHDGMYIHKGKMRVTPDLKNAILADETNLLLLDLEKRLFRRQFKAGGRVETVSIQPDGTSVVSLISDYLKPTKIKHFHFCALPEERLKTVAQKCLCLTSAEPKGELALLPQFAQAEILAMLSRGISWEESFNIYTALTVLPIIRGFLQQALNGGREESLLISEAVARINSLPDPISEMVRANFSAIHPHAQFVGKDQINAGIEAINRTLREFESRLRRVVI